MDYFNNSNTEFDDYKEDLVLEDIEGEEAMTSFVTLNDHPFNSKKY